MNRNTPYRAKEFHLSGLSGISDQTLQMHFKLYEGYVKETNRPTALQDLKEGDQVAVQMKIAKQPSSMPSATLSKK